MNNIDFDPKWFEKDGYGNLYPKPHTQIRFCPTCDRERAFISDSINPTPFCMVCGEEKEE